LRTSTGEHDNLAQLHTLDPDSSESNRDSEEGMIDNTTFFDMSLSRNECPYGDLTAALISVFSYQPIRKSLKRNFSSHNVLNESKELRPTLIEEQSAASIMKLQWQLGQNANFRDYCRTYKDTGDTLTILMDVIESQEDHEKVVLN
jgi:hypothetical protein